MDLYKAIQELYAEKEKLERVIASLEELQRNAGAQPAPRQAKRRGRKSMNSRERQEVSERMKRYWESRRRGRKPNDPGQSGQSKGD
jgi:septal ring factor EnvC (AmiA/AmiB activator)